VTVRRRALLQRLEDVARPIREARDREARRKEKAIALDAMTDAELQASIRKELAAGAWNGDALPGGPLHLANEQAALIAKMVRLQARLGDRVGLKELTDGELDKLEAIFEQIEGESRASYATGDEPGRPGP
jgi:hypothetical protein